MANKKIFRIIQAGLLGAVLALSFPACTDDNHFDVKSGGEAGANATLTLWEQISSNPDLSRFAAIVEKTPYFKDETHPVKEYTFKDVLNGTQILTVFAPTNDAFTESEYQDLLKLCETAPYDVFLRIVGNHIACNKYNATGTGVEKLVMINNKKGMFDRQAKTFKGISLVKTNIPAVNGTLHTMSVCSPFAYNIYEYIKANGDQFSHLKDWITSHDTIFFNASASIQGGTDADGNPIYVDSVYYRQNNLFRYNYTKTGEEWVMPIKGFNGDLEEEDSTYAMILPTDQAWEEAIDSIERFYNYCELYVDKRREDEGVVGKTFGASPDSLKQLAIQMDITSPLLYNIHMQPESKTHIGFWSAEDFKNSPLPKMFNMRRDTIKHIDGGDIKEWLTNGADPIEVSNGLVYPVNTWRYKDLNNFKDVNIKLQSNVIFQNKELGTTSAEWISFDNSSSKLVTDSLLGSISSNNNNTTGYMVFENGLSAPTVQIKLIDQEQDKQVLSGVEYDVYLVMVPDFYRYDPNSILTPAYKNRINARIKYNTGTVNKGSVKEQENKQMTLEYEGTKVDTLLLGNITFPVSYKNIQNSYPVITLTSGAKKTEVTSGEYSHGFSIDRIILKAK
ncbi:MAG: fasciclin domain-containing protein [Bacteroidaceae bacterium]|nr:fasciclin domain-containing protein [Bacteroidaceae bacterium]